MAPPRDRTTYFEALPANQLALGLYLEADRMRSLVINKANLDNQRNAVQEERRLGLDSQAYGKSGEIQALVYDNTTQAFGDRLDGRSECCECRRCRSLLQNILRANNAVLAVVGDFKTADALKIIKEYFEKIPRQRSARGRHDEPEQRS
jgi:predicted Zn-dependent peptidase